MPHRVGERLAVVALVEVEAGLVTFGDIQRQLPVVLADGQLGVAGAFQPAGRLLQAFERARTRIAAFIDALDAARLQQRFDDRRLEALDAGREELRAEHIAVAVDDQARQAIRLAVD